MVKNVLKKKFEKKDDKKDDKNVLGKKKGILKKNTKEEPKDHGCLDL